MSLYAIFTMTIAAVLYAPPILLKLRGGTDCDIALSSATAPCEVLALHAVNCIGHKFPGFN